MKVFHHFCVVCLSLAFAAGASGVQAQEQSTLNPSAVVPPKASDSKSAASAATRKKPPAIKKPAATKAARKAKARKQADAIATPVPAAKLDLTLPKAMVDKLEPPSKEAQVPVAGKPLLPEMFAQKKTEADDFQLNGRILSNEMELPMIRNEGRGDIEGAALDFKFKQ